MNDSPDLANMVQMAVWARWPVYMPGLFRLLLYTNSVVGLNVNACFAYLVPLHPVLRSEGTRSTSNVKYLPFWLILADFLLDCR